VLSCLLGNAQNLEFIADAEFMKDLFRYEMFVAGFADFMNHCLFCSCTAEF
jgi:hypothetical protein